MQDEHFAINARLQLKPAYETLVGALQKAGASQGVLKALAKGSGVTAFNTSGVEPSLGAAVQHTLDGRSVLNDSRFSALDKLAAERARLEYERTGNEVEAVKAALDSVKQAKSQDVGQSPMFGASSKDIQNLAFESYRDSLVKGAPELIDGRVVRGTLTGYNYAGPSHEFSPEDFMTAEQNRVQLEANQEKLKARQKALEKLQAQAKTVQDYTTPEAVAAAQATQARRVETGPYVVNRDVIDLAAHKNARRFAIDLGDLSGLGQSLESGQSHNDVAAAAQGRGQAASKSPAPSRASSMTRAHLSNYYGYISADDPNNKSKKSGYKSFGGWMRAVNDALETGWHGDPTKNPRRSLLNKKTTPQSGVSVEQWTKTQKNIDKERAKQEKLNRQRQEAEVADDQVETGPANTDENEDQPINSPTNTVGKTNRLGGGANANVPGLLGFTSTAQQSRARTAVAGSASSNDNRYAPSKTARAASTKTSVQKTIDRYYKDSDGPNGSGGAPNSGAYEGAVSAAADDQSLHDDDFWDGYEAGTRAYDKANSDGKDSGGKSIVCTAMNQRYGFGGFRNALWVKYAEDHLTKQHEVGYHAMFKPLVKFACRGADTKPKRMVRRVLEHIARHRSVDIWREMRGAKRDPIGRLERAVLEPLCFLVGWLKR